MKISRSQKWQKILYGGAVVIRLGLGCMFIISSLPKIRQPYDFLSDIYNYEIVGPKLGMLTAMTLPWLELLIGICLVGGIFISGALLISIGLGAMFSYAIALALYRGFNISCGCFGASSFDTLNYVSLIRALLIIFFSGLAYLAMAFLQSNS